MYAKPAIKLVQQTHGSTYLVSGNSFLLASCVCVRYFNFRFYIFLFSIRWMFFFFRFIYSLVDLCSPMASQCRSLIYFSYLFYDLSTTKGGIFLFFFFFFISETSFAFIQYIYLYKCFFPILFVLPQSKRIQILISQDCNGVDRLPYFIISNTFSITLQL